jgi:hypothetical protein
MARQFLCDVDLTGQLQLKGSAGTNGHFLGSGGGSGLPVWRGIEATDLPTTNVTQGVYGSSTQIPIITVDSYGRLTAASTATIASAEVDPVIVAMIF